MRTLKLRAWDAKDNKMYDPVDLNDFERSECFFQNLEDNANFMADEDCTLMQYTGLKDKQGNEIYEDDIVQNDEGEIAQVYYNQTSAQFMCDLIGEGGKRIYDEFSIDDFCGMVIGNIYEDKELLENL